MQQKNIITLSAIASITIVSITALILVLGGKFNSSWSENDGLKIIIEKQQIPMNTND